MVEQHVGTDARMQLTGKKREDVTAEAFADSVGIGSYRIDLHPSSGLDNYIDAMKRWGEARGAVIGTRYAENFRQHIGHPHPTDDILKSALGDPTCHDR